MKPYYVDEAVLCRALAYLDARTAIISTLGWGFSIQWWLCKPDGAQ